MPTFQPIRSLTVAICSVVGCFLLAGCSRTISSREYLERGILLAQRESYHEALENFNRSLDLEPGNADTYYERAIVYELVGRDALAREDYSSAIRLSPDFALSYNNRGLLLSRLELHEEAVRDFSRMIQLEADNPNAYESRGRAYAALNKPHEAIADFSQAILLESASLGLDLNARKLTLDDELSSDAEEEVGQDLLEALGSQYNASLLALRGQQQLALKNYEDALSDFDLALQQDAELAKAWLGRGIALANIGEVEEAMLDLEEAANADLGIVSDDIILALKKIASLQAQNAKPVGTEQATQLDPQAEVLLVPEDLESYLASKAWKLLAPIDGYSLYDIQSQESNARSTLFFVEVDANGCLKMSGPQYATLVKSSQPKSLLMNRPQAKGGPKFVPNWNTAGLRLQHVAVEFDEPETEKDSPTTQLPLASKAGSLAAE